MKRIEIIVAVRNEADAVSWFVDELGRLPLPAGVHLGITFVEDGSTDGTVQRLKDLATQNSQVRAFSLERGFGQIPALLFGLSQSEADAYILMDVDGSHPLSVIPFFISKFLDGAQLVQGWRKDRSRQSGIRKVGAVVFRWTVRALCGVDLTRQTVYFRLLDNSWRNKVLGDRRGAYFFRLRLPPQDSRVQYVQFDFVERGLGKSKYSVLRLVRFASIGILSLMSPARISVLLGVPWLLCLWGTLRSYWFLLPLSMLTGIAAVYWAMGKYSPLDRMSCHENRSEPCRS